MEIRIANVADAKAIQKIYEPYVKNTAVSFEYEVPSIQEFEGRIQNTLKEYPYLVVTTEEADSPGKIIGYAYASAFHPRIAYKHTAELSVYIDENYRRKGIGRELYNRLQEILIQQNVYTVYACIASPEKEDEYLTNDSEHFHEKMGFKLAGRHELCGYKFKRWYNMIWMENHIADRPEIVAPFIPFGQIDPLTYNVNE